MQQRSTGRRGGWQQQVGPACEWPTQRKKSHAADDRVSGQRAGTSGRCWDAVRPGFPVRVRSEHVEHAGEDWREALTGGPCGEREAAGRWATAAHGPRWQ
jgi:hypothetical protein